MKWNPRTHRWELSPPPYMPKKRDGDSKGYNSGKSTTRKLIEIIVGLIAVVIVIKILSNI